MPQTIKITRDIDAPVSQSVSTGKNRFSGCPTSNKKTTKTSSCGCTIQDIKWYPEEKKLVIEKKNQPDLTVDIGEVVGEQSKTTSDIRVNIWNEDKQKYDVRDLIATDTDFTVALQNVVDALGSDTSNIFRVNVTKVVKEVAPKIDVKTKHDISIIVFNPEVGERTEELVVPVDTNVTDAIENTVNNDPTVKQDIIVKVFNPELPEPEDKVVVDKDTRMTVALQKIANADPTIKNDITAKVYNPETETAADAVIVENNTEITKALQTIVDKLRSWDAWD